METVWRRLICQFTWIPCKLHLLIQSFADETTEDLFNGKNSKSARKIPRDIWPLVGRKLDMLNAAQELGDLKSPPGNRLEALKGDQRGRHSIRVNDQYRLTFRFAGSHAHEVRCEDYH